MKTMVLFTGLLMMVGTLMSSIPAAAADFSLTIVNTTNGVYFTPLLITAHEENVHLFEAGQPASAELQAMAEGGDIS